MNNKFNRKKSRKYLYQVLYAMTFNNYEEEKFKESFFENVFTFSSDEDYINKMQKIITHYETFFIHIIKKYSPKFDISKMSFSYIWPIYIALAEMFFLEEEIPGKVSINEAVEISKVYWDDSSKKVVNWVLNKVLNDYEELFKEKDNTFDGIKISCFKK